MPRGSSNGSSHRIVDVTSRQENLQVDQTTTVSKPELEILKQSSGQSLTVRKRKREGERKKALVH